MTFNHQLGAHGRACLPQISVSLQGVALQAVGVSEGVHLNFQGGHLPTTVFLLTHTD